MFGENNDHFGSSTSHSSNGISSHTSSFGSSHVSHNSDGSVTHTFTNNNFLNISMAKICINPKFAIDFLI